MKIRSFFIFIILFITSSLAILSFSTINDNLSDLQTNIHEQNKVQYLELLLIASEKIYDEHQRARIAKLYHNQGPIDFNATNIAIDNLIKFSQQSSIVEGFPHDKYTALQIKILAENIRAGNAISNDYVFRRLETIIERRIMRIQNSSSEFMVSLEGVRLTSRLYAHFTELIDQFIDIARSDSLDEEAHLKAVKLLGAIEETENRLIIIKDLQLIKTKGIDQLLDDIFNHDIINVNSIIYNNDGSFRNDINLQQIDVSYIQAKQHIATLNDLLFQQAIDISTNQVYQSRIKIYSMICFLIIFFLFSILPISVMIFKLGGAFSLVQKAIIQLSNNDLNIQFNENQSRFSFELESIINSLIKLKNIQIEKSNLENKNHELISQLKQNSTTDFLTNISNRRAFLENIQDSPSEFYRHSTLAIIDIDNFKQINDRFGHGGGDEVLIRFSSLLKSFFRKNDLFCRYGGEEFAILLHDCNLTLAKKILERLCKKVRYLSVVLSTGEKVFFTISVGADELEDKTVINQSIMKADKALYHAKSTGKDRVIVYSPEIE